MSDAVREGAGGGGAGSQMFEAERPRLLGLAYRMLGSLPDAEDVVQETWIRWSTSEGDAIVNPAAWLTTVCTRVALDRIKHVKRRREAYVGPWLPDPVSTEPTPEQHAELAESLTLGFLIMLDRLSAVERAVFLLADVFDEPYSVIAESVGKTEAACRQLASRARHKMHTASEEATSTGPGAHGRVVTGAPASAELLGELMATVLAGDEARALELLDPGVVLMSDGGPYKRAARRPVVGADRVYRLNRGGWRLLGVSGWDEAASVPFRLSWVNGGAAVVMDAPAGRVVLSGEEKDGRVARIWVRLNPDKVSGLDRDIRIR